MSPEAILSVVGERRRRFAVSKLGRDLGSRRPLGEEMGSQRALEFVWPEAEENPPRLGGPDARVSRRAALQPRKLDMDNA